MARFDAWAGSAGAPEPERETRRAELGVLAARRNRFVHELDGSPWDPDPDREPPHDDVEDTFHRVGRLAVWIAEAAG